MYEGFAPHRVPVMVECLTDNVNRAASEMRVLFRKGQLGTSGTVSWDFAHVGLIEAEAASKSAGIDTEARSAWEQLLADWTEQNAERTRAGQGPLKPGIVWHWFRERCGDRPPPRGCRLPEPYCTGIPSGRAA